MMADSRRVPPDFRTSLIPVTAEFEQRLQRLQSDLALVLLRDRHRLRQRLRALWRDFRGKKRKLEVLNARYGELEKAIEASCCKRRSRLEGLPRPEYPEALPVCEHREAIKQAIAKHQVVVVAGETGSGKTTQLPKICLELGRGVDGLIGHTQPRRLAARSVASRIAAELRGEVGHAVGYKVRFSDHVSPRTYVKLMTDGILLAEARQDRFLEQYDTLIIDEAHERSLNIDFLLGYLKRLLPKRPDLKLIITSATIDTARFSRHFDDAPVIEVSGRTYPVEIRYRPLVSTDEDEIDRDQQQAILDAVDELAALDQGQGDVLVFLSGEREIRETAEALRKHHPPHTEILPLYARLSAAEQNRIFQPHRGRRIVLATNVAETSLTVPGIRYVIDSGFARLSRYSYRSKVQRLPVERVSRASADQRAGRCGRVGPGVCIRLYSEEDYAARPRFTDPEIKRTNLAAVILQMQALGLGHIEDFPFVDPPDSRYVQDGFRLLFELGAVDEFREITALGQQLARLPVDPRLGRMLLAASELNCLREVLIITSALAIQDPRERPAGKRDKVAGAQAAWADERSDFFVFLNLWRDYEERRRHLSQNKLRKYCKSVFLSYVRMREWHDTHAQLHAQMREMGFRINEEDADADRVHQALLSGLLGNLGFRLEDKQYQGARNTRFMIFPGSGLSGKPPKWLMAAALIETSRLYAHTVAAIRPEWIEGLAGHLVRRSHSEPRWERRPARVAANEQVTLYGLVIVPGRKVDYGGVNPEEAREIFIRRALVEGDYASRAPFFRHNRELIGEIEALEHKSRRRDVLVDEEVLYAFYDARIPAHVHSGAAFEKWRRKAERKEPKYLFLSRERLMRREADHVSEERFPESVELQGLRLQLDYHFEPGSRDDGVTVNLPLAALNQLDEGPLNWLVPGLLQEKLVALIKTLPKALRRHFVPAPDFAVAAMQAMPFGQGDLIEVFSRQLQRMTGYEVPANAWNPERLPTHLRMNFRLLDEQGREVDMGRDLEALRRRHASRVRQSFAGTPLREEREESPFERTGLTRWDFGDLPGHVTVQRGGLSLRAWPALVDEDGQVSLRLFDNPSAAGNAMVTGQLRLFQHALGKSLRTLRRNLPGLQEMCLACHDLSGCDELAQDLLDAVVMRACMPDGAVRDQAAFEAALESGRPRLMSLANAICDAVHASLKEYRIVRKRLKGNLPPAWLEAVADMREQLDNLIHPGFVASTPDPWLARLPVYLRAMALRLDKLPERQSRDHAAQREIEPFWRAWREQIDAGRPIAPEWIEFRWLIEELRVSLFAQQLKTLRPVSVKRLQQRLRDLGG